MNELAIRNFLLANVDLHISSLLVLLQMNLHIQFYHLWKR